VHPWLIHSGSVNLSDAAPRILANGMARIKQSSWKSGVRNQVLQATTGTSA